MFDETVRGIHVKESEDPIQLCDIAAMGAIAVSTRFTSDFRLRRVVYDKLIAAQARLPQGLRFLVYEAFRPRSRQIILWDAIWAQLRAEHPDWDENALYIQAEKFVADPYRFGSGHQSGAAVDITVITADGDEWDMGTPVQGFGPLTKTDNDAITDDVRMRRACLRQALEDQGLINYPEEWWHYSYGDRLWAEVTGRAAAFFAPIPDERTPV